MKMCDVFCPDGPALVWLVFDGFGNDHQGRPAFKLYRSDSDITVGVEPAWTEDYSCEGWEMCLTGGDSEMPWMMQQCIPPYHSFLVRIQPPVWSKSPDTSEGDGEWECETFGEVVLVPSLSPSEHANLWAEGAGIDSTKFLRIA